MKAVASEMQSLAAQGAAVGAAAGARQILSPLNPSHHRKPSAPWLRRARLQELMLERGEASGHELFEHEDRERLATANAQRNIVSGWDLGPL
jgi:hypothetical protein